MKLEKEDVETIKKSVQGIDNVYRNIAPKINQAFDKACRLAEACKLVHEHVKRLLKDIILDDKESLTETLYELLIKTHEIQYEISDIERLLRDIKPELVNLAVSLFNLETTLKSKQGA